MNTTMMSDDNQDEDFNIKDTLEKYLAHWTWFAIGVFLCLCIAYVYLRYATPVYQAKTTILVKDDKKGGMLSELSAFTDLGLGGGLKGNVDNEIEILKSWTLVESTVKKLKLNVSILEKGQINTIDIYDNAPIAIQFTNIKPTFYEVGVSWEFVKLSANTFKLINSNGEEANQGIPKVLNTQKEFRYGEIIPTAIGDMIITKTAVAKYPKAAETSTFIVVSPLEDVVASYLGRVQVDPVSKTSSVVSISFADTNSKRAKVFLDKMIQIYNDDAAADKNFISENTSKFIANRLILITQELDGVEQDVENFKQTNGLTDIESEAKLFIQGSSDYNKLNVQNEIQLNVVVSMLDFMKKSSNSDLLPANLITGVGDTSQLISSYNQLVLQRNRILQSATISNPAVKKLDEEIVSLKSNVKESLLRLQSNLTIQKRNFEGQEGLLASKIGKIPVQERLFRVIARQQKVKEELYLYLLQKREETAISLSATAPNARVIDVAKADRWPIAPKKGVIYLASFLFGLLIPFSILYIKDLLDTKVNNRLDITNRLNIPFLGDVPKTLTPDKIFDATSRSSTSEALRIVRTNLDYMLTQVADGTANIIFVTSTIPGEGKTFTSANLAAVFSHSGKKVLLIGMDIRKPKLNRYFGITERKGLTDYLSTKNAEIKDYIFQMKGYEAFDVLLGGTIPPNPTEMLMSKKIDELFLQLRPHYDYIIVDTAPVNLVSDTLIVAKHADTFVYVVRANFLDRRMLHIPKMLHLENKLPNMALILNDTIVKKVYGYGEYGGYGVYGYGTYGYDISTEKKPWYKTILNKNKK